MPGGTGRAEGSLNALESVWILRRGWQVPGDLPLRCSATAGAPQQWRPVHGRFTALAPAQFLPGGGSPGAAPGSRPCVAKHEPVL